MTHEQFAANVAGRIRHQVATHQPVSAEIAELQERVTVLEAGDTVEADV